MKLIFLDVDGTLTPAGSNDIPESARRAIDETRRLGNKVLLCSGRNPGMLKPIMDAYPFDGMVACAGGYVETGQKVLYDHPMSDELRDKALSVLHKNHVFVTLETRDMSYGDENLGEFLASADSTNSEIERWRKALSNRLNIRPMKEYDGKPAYKIVVMCTKMEQLDEPKKVLGNDFHFALQEVQEHANAVNGDLINKSFDKGKGLRIAAEYYHVLIQDTYGFGDSMNDWEMMKTAGTSICMGNGAASLKAISDMVTASVQEDGLAKAFKSLNLVNI